MSCNKRNAIVLFLLVALVAGCAAVSGQVKDPAKVALFTVNVDNVVRNLAGEYTVSLKTALPDANYSVLCNAENGASFVAMICSVSGPSQAVGSFIVHTADNTAHLSDARTFYIQVFR
jgi:hypothetical protein